MQHVHNNLLNLFIAFREFIVYIGSKMHNIKIITKLNYDKVYNIYYYIVQNNLYIYMMKLIYIIIGKLKNLFFFFLFPF